jgi:hypothetical protein
MARNGPAREGNAVTYETKIAIEIAGIRRAVPLVFRYHVKTISGKRTPIHESASMRCGRSRFPGDWVYEAMGVRQLRELDDELLAHWAPENRSNPRAGGKA